MSIDPKLMDQIIMLTAAGGQAGEAGRAQLEAALAGAKGKAASDMELRAEKLKQALEDRKDIRQQMHDDASEQRADARMASMQKGQRYALKQDEGGYTYLPVDPTSGVAPVHVDVRKPISPQDRQHAAAFDRTAATMQQLAEEGKAHPEYFSPVHDAAVEAMAKIPLVGSVAGAMGRSTYGDNALNWRTRMSTLRNEYLKDMSGAAVTESEQQRDDAAYPYTPGVGYKDFLAKAPGYISTVKGRADAMRGAYAPPAPSAPTAPSVPSAPSAAAGPVYSRVDGKLVRVQ